MGAMSRGWTLTRQSWAVLRKDRSLAAFPILSTIIALLAVVAVWVPAAVLSGPNFAVVDDNNPIFIVASVGTYFLIIFIGTFFNVALASCAARSLRGEDTRVVEGLTDAARRIGPIMGWTAVAGTVGVFLSAIRDRLPGAALAERIVGAVWEVASFFVIPVIALENIGPWRALKHSVDVVKVRWGEAATGAATIAVSTVAVAIPFALIGYAGASSLMSDGFSPLGFTAATVGVVGVIVVSIVASAINGIFRVAVYLYSVTGETPDGFDAAVMRSAFRRPVQHDAATTPAFAPGRTREQTE